ncbi:MAG TPA: hypothetical protein VK016_02370 [Arenimonas sp.]|jgi:hypothetical protein|nr:hypothetical protein [Arenimonas sp.]
MSRIASTTILSLWLLALLPAAAPAQDVAPAQAMARVQALLDASEPGKQIFIARQLQLSHEEAAGFWPIYDAYQATLADLAERRGRLLAALQGASGSQAVDLAEDLSDLDMDEAEQRQRMFLRLARAIPVEKAIAYLELETSLAALRHFRQRAADRYASG